MTLTEMGALIRRYKKIFIIIFIAATLGGLGVGFIKSNKDSSDTTAATARIIANQQVNGVVGLAQGIIEESQESYTDIEADVTSKNTPNTIEITMTGNDLQTCIEYANYVANEANRRASELYTFVGGDQNAVLPYRGIVQEASFEHIMREQNEENSGIKSVLKFCIAGCFGGLILATCIVLLIDYIKRPIRGASQIMNSTGLPILGYYPTNDRGERMISNISFAAKEHCVKELCLVPIGHKKCAERIGELLQADNHQVGRIEAVSYVVMPCEPIAASVSTVYEARNADATIVIVRRWDDSMPQLLDALGELKLAGATTIGIVLYEG